MRKTLIASAVFLSILFIAACFSFAEENTPAPKSGIDDLTLNIIKSAPSQKDYPDMPFVYLYIKESDDANKNGTGTYRMHMIWKALDSRAVSQGEVGIPFDADKSTLDITLARTIKPDNTVVNVEKDDIKENTPFSGFPLYSNFRVKQFRMPAIEAGSIVEYKAVLKVTKPKVPGLFYSYWSFPPGIPIKESIFEVNAPESLNLKYLARNLSPKPVIHSAAGRKTYAWEAKDIFIGGIFEPFLPPYDVVCPNLTVASARTWDDIVSWFRSASEPKLAPSAEMKDYIDAVVQSENNDKRKIMEHIYSTVSREIRYVDIPLKASDLVPNKAADIFAGKYGDGKDKCALLIALYRSIGVDAYFAFLKNRSQGPLIREFPTTEFTGCVVAVPRKEGGYLLLDPTLELNKFGYVPMDLRDADILVIKKDGYEFIKLPIIDIVSSGTRVEIDAVLGSDHTLSVDEKDTYYGDAEIAKRLAAKYSSQDAANAYFEEGLKSIYPTVRFGSVMFSDPSNLTEQFAIMLKYDIKEYAKEAGRLLVIDIPSVQLNVAASTEKREHALWLPALNKDEVLINITIPEGMKINSLPGNMEKETIFGSFKREVASDKNKITVKVLSEARMLIIPPEQYEKYKEFIDHTFKALKEAIVLEKVENS